MAELNNEHNSLNGQMRGSKKRAGKSSDSTRSGLGSGSSSTNGVPCGACKYLRRKCVNGCIFAPHFHPEQGTSLFAAVHKIFGASNVSKLLVQLPPYHRHHAIQTLSYEAQARLADPVNGCVSVVLDLSQQVVSLKKKIAMAQNLLAERLMAENTPQGPPQQPKQLNNHELLPVYHHDLQPVYSNGSSTSNNMINMNMNMFDSNLHNPANDQRYVVYSQPIFNPPMFTGPYLNNEDDVEEFGEPLVFANHMF